MLNTVIIGAGPYGLSLGAHFRQTGIPFRIFGRPMDSWLAHMPKGMMLKSDGFASNLSDPNSQLSLRKFCAERKIEYGDTGVPVRLDTFTSYGLTFPVSYTHLAARKFWARVSLVLEATFPVLMGPK